MRIIRKKKSGNAHLVLKVNVVQARKITVENSGCNPICVVTTNGAFSKSSKLKNTTSPQWRQVLKLKLPKKPYSEHLRVVIYDVLSTDHNSSPQQSSDHRSGSSSSALNQRSTTYLYLGEVKVSLLDIFKKKEGRTSYNFKKEPTWYNLYNKNSLKKLHKNGSLAALSLAIGEIQLGFSLTYSSKNETTFKAFNDWHNSLIDTLQYNKSLKEHSSSGNVPTVKTLALQQENLSMQSCTASSDDTDFEDIVDKSIMSENEDEADSPDFMTLKYLYENEEEEDVDVDLDGDVDVDVDVEPEDEDDTDLRKVVSALDEYEITFPEGVKNDSREDVQNPMNPSAVDFSETDPTYEEGSDVSDEDSHEMIIQKKKRRPRRRIKRTSKFEVSKKEHAMGVVFLDVEKISNLPPLRNKFSKTYDMDPFVIITFGRRVFKTSWRKHSLNPTYHETVVFEIYENETNFHFHFKVIDRDSFSYHDNVADGSISWREMIELQQREKNSDGFSYELPLTLHDETVSANCNSKLYLRFKYVPYQVLKKQFWERVISATSTLDSFDIVDLSLFLANLGTFSDEEVLGFFYHFNKSPWSHDKLSREEVVEYFQFWKNSTGFNNVKRCPLCNCHCKSGRNVLNSKLTLDNDLITHFAICATGERKILKPSYVSSDFASKRWFSKLLIKLTYGKYALGSNNANILVQDRDTGIVIEEKISAHVKLGIRIIYNGKGTESRKFKSLLRNLSIKQGKKFDSPSSVKEIEPFIKFHSLDISQCENSDFKTFNDFFYRKLKPGSRLPEVDNPKILLSPADCRCVVFPTINKSKEVWIKGKSFTLTKLTGNHHPEVFNDRSCGIGIFRLAPQDYHRFHCPCDGVIGKIKYISGEYYTVNPMAIRTELDVFGENVRVVVPIHSPEFGTILYIAVGAMMVGSIILTCKEGEKVNRGQELGYFKFGGSTVLLVIPNKKVVFDTDLVNNSREGIETLVKVGMSVGHTPDVNEHRREKVVVKSKEEIEKIKRTITVTDDSASRIGNVSWEYHTLRKLASSSNGSSNTCSSPHTTTNEEDDITELLSVISD